MTGSLLASIRWLEFSSGLLGAAVGGAATIVAVLVTQGREEKRDRQEDARRIRRARADRLREAYTRVAVVIDGLEFAGKDMAITRAGETNEQQSKRITGVLSALIDGFGLALASLRLESETEEAMETYIAVHDAFIALQVAFQTNAQFPQTYSADDLQEHLQTLSGGAPIFFRAAKAHLVALEQPI